MDLVRESIDSLKGSIDSIKDSVELIKDFVEVKDSVQTSHLGRLDLHPQRLG